MPSKKRCRQSGTRHNEKRQTGDESEMSGLRYRHVQNRRQIIAVKTYLFQYKTKPEQLGLVLFFKAVLFYPFFCIPAFSHRDGFRINRFL